MYRQKISFFKLSRFLQDGTLPGDVVGSLTLMWPYIVLNFL